MTLRIRELNLTPYHDPRDRRGGRAVRVAFRSLLRGFLIYLFTLLPGCTYQHDRGLIAQLDDLSAGAQPVMRVRVVKRINEIELDTSGHLHLMCGGDGVTASTSNSTRIDPGTSVQIRRRGGRFVIQTSSGRQFGCGHPQVIAVAAPGSMVRVRGQAYPGRLILSAAVSELGEDDQFDVINHVPIEQYLPGVLERELLRGWDSSTYAAQAIAARSYAIDQKAHRRGRPFDVEATVQSQVYGGASTYSRALEAVKRTRGVVLTYRNHVLPAYYSSTCGGTGQDAAIAFPNGADIPPLKGHKHDNWCSASSNFRWGPVVRDADVLAQRIAMWGQRRQHPVASLQGIRQVAVSSWSDSGRPAGFRVTDQRGQAFAIDPESFRFACNAHVSGLEKLSKVTKFKSSDVRVTIQDRWVRIEGRGHGHGVGLCQWGAQALAKRGYDAHAILAYYYPKAKLVKVY